MEEHEAAVEGGGMVNWSKHLKHENPEFSPTFKRIVDEMSAHFDVEVYASRWGGVFGVLHQMYMPAVFCCLSLPSTLNPQHTYPTTVAAHVEGELLPSNTYRLPPPLHHFVQWRTSA
jgi:hypothetical protein